MRRHPLSLFHRGVYIFSSLTALPLIRSSFAYPQMTDGSDYAYQAIPSSVKTAPPAQPDDNPFTSEEHDHNLDMSAQRVATPYMSVASHPDGSRETLQPTPKLDLGSALWVLGVAQSSEQPSNRRLWSRRVARFSCGHAEDVIPIDSTAVKVARDIGRGVAIIVVIPIALAVAGLAGTGVIVYGFGLVLRGIGSAFTCGVAN